MVAQVGWQDFLSTKVINSKKKKKVINSREKYFICPYCLENWPLSAHSDFWG